MKSNIKNIPSPLGDGDWKAAGVAPQPAAINNGQDETPGFNGLWFPATRAPNKKPLLQPLGQMLQTRLEPCRFKSLQSCPKVSASYSPDWPGIAPKTRLNILPGSAIIAGEGISISAAPTLPNFKTLNVRAANKYPVHTITREQLNNERSLGNALVFPQTFSKRFKSIWSPVMVTRRAAYKGGHDATVSQM